MEMKMKWENNAPRRNRKKTKWVRSLKWKAANCPPINKSLPDKLVDVCCRREQIAGRVNHRIDIEGYWFRAFRAFRLVSKWGNRILPPSLTDTCIDFRAMSCSALLSPLLTAAQCKRTFGGNFSEGLCCDICSITNNFSNLPSICIDEVQHGMTYLCKVNDIEHVFVYGKKARKTFSETRY